MTTQIPLTPILTEALAIVAEKVRQATVQVKGSRSEAGSGVIWQADGLIITNSHVVHGKQVEVKLTDGRVFSATVQHRNRSRDLVALKVDAINLPAATIADSHQLRVGEFVLAIGSPLGLASAVTTGIIHTVGTESAPHQHWIQADIALAPGNSGGPLANAQGQVIGINTMIVNGRGFAIASQTVQRFLQQAGEQPYLGVTLQPVHVAVQFRKRYGLIITALEPNSPAAEAQLQIGDVLIGVRGQLFQHSHELFQILECSNSGDGLSLNFLRGQEQRVAEIVLCSRDLNRNVA